MLPLRRQQELRQRKIVWPLAGTLLLAGTLVSPIGWLHAAPAGGGGRAASTHAGNGGPSTGADVEAREEITSFQRDKNWRGLAARLKGADPEVRQLAARALQELAADEVAGAQLEQVVPALVVAMLNDSSPQVRQPARFALRSAIEKVDDQEVLIDVMHALVANLRHEDETIRAHCAHDLARVVGRIDERAALANVLAPLAVATLKAESMDADDFAGFALRNALRKIDDQHALIPAMRVLLVGLKHKNATMRAYSAHDLSENMSKIDDETALVGMMGPIMSAALQHEASRARLSAGFALRQILDRISDETALRSAVSPLARALASDDVAQRRYAAHAITLFARKIDDPNALTPLIQPLVHAHFHDSDQRVRELSARALQHAFDRPLEPRAAS